MNCVERICEDLKLDYTYVMSIVKFSGYYYKDYKIPKNNGGYRIISQPSPELKTLQYWVVHNVLSKLPISSYSFAYNKGSSIKKHALIHSKSNYIFHSDIKDFFPSIKSAMLNDVLIKNEQLFSELGINVNDSIEQIDKICFRNNCLSIGAVSSPMISNVIMYSFDLSFNDYCNNKNLIYSRYADDIYVSSKSYIDNEVKVMLKNTLHEFGFCINNKKTSFYSPKGRKIVTGLIITNEKRISVGTDRRNGIKKMVYEKVKHNKGNPNVIIGYLAYLKDIEPATYDRIVIKYSKYCEGDIIDIIRENTD